MDLEQFTVYSNMVYLRQNSFKKALSVFLTSFLIIACNSRENSQETQFDLNKKEISFFLDYDSVSTSKEWNINTKMIKDEGNKFERYQENQLYGHTFDLKIPDSFSNSSVVVKTSFKYRLHSLKPGNYVFSASIKEGENMFWEGKPFIADSGKWAIFEDSITLPAKRDPNLNIRLHPFNPDKTIFDLDSFTITLQQKSFPSFLTDIKKNLHHFPKVKLNNPIFNSVALASVIDNKIEESSIKLSKNKIVGGNHHFNIEAFQTNKNNGIVWDIKTRFKKKSKVNRLALIYNYKGNITEVYRNNRIVSNKIYGNEIWIGNQGFRLNLDSLDWFCYGNNNVSSLQILKKQKLLIVNIDYSQDHPLFHFPKLDNLINQKEDLSANIYEPNENIILHNHFQITPSKTIKSVPRILPTQHGYQSAFLWTEHADFTDLKLHKITYYGDENASGPSEATAGFVFHNIPVTKSVFYTVNDTLKNDDYPESFFNSQLTSVKKTPGFEAFLDSLHALGSEICLHTPDFFTSNKETMEEALEYITKKYGSQTWIDHGYNNGEHDNREDFMCDGLDNYAFSLWKKNKIRYFWNGYFEDTLIQNKFRSSISRTIPFYGFEDQLPYPIIWKNKKAPGFFSWRTSTVFFPENGETWNYSFSDNILEDFTANYGIEFSHVYPAHSAHKGFWTCDEDSNFSIQPEFETTLKKMSLLRDKGILQIPTVSKFMKHQENLSLIDYQIENNKIIILNNGNDIKGLTLVVKKSNLPQKFSEIFPNHRINGNDMIFWFDLKKGDKKTIEF
tara:strand:- start:220 stop:2577 length:2358 start_codon:yes stop_codon:yes gene_type:complete